MSTILAPLWFNFSCEIKLYFPATVEKGARLGWEARRAVIWLQTRKVRSGNQEVQMVCADVSSLTAVPDSVSQGPAWLALCCSLVSSCAGTWVSCTSMTLCPLPLALLYASPVQFAHWGFIYTHICMHILYTHIYVFLYIHMYAHTYKHTL